MVSKLLKYDLRAYFRVMAPAYLVLLSIALITRLVQVFEPPLYDPYMSGMSMTPTQVYSIIFTSLLVLLALACVVVYVLTLAQTILVFYRNLFTREGYLSFTLPVTTGQHLCAKVLGALIVNIASLVAVLVAGCIASFGEMLAEVWKAGWYLLGEVRDWTGTGNLVGYCVEGIVFLLVATVALYLFLYLCITIGQQAKKNRVLAAFGVFFGFYMLGQFLLTGFVVTIFIDDSWIIAIFEWLESLRFGAVHLMLCSGIVWYAAVSVVGYLINRSLISRRLNLE